MKLSQLLDREDFYRILDRTLNNNSFFKISYTENQLKYNSFKYLNIIFHNTLEPKVSSTLVFEYSLSKAPIRQIVQKIYIKLIFLPGIREIFADKRILLPASLSNYAIVPGNHRIRLFDASLKKITILLKSNESSKFIKNDIEARVKNNLTYAPRILSFGEDWIVEEFIAGIPQNRILVSLDSKRDVEQLLIMHNAEMVLKSKYQMNIEDYMRRKLAEISSLIELLHLGSELRRNILFDLEEFKRQLLPVGLSTIEISMTHGDFQQGNLRVNSVGKIFLLDWESADERFYLYDAFVLLSGIRTGIGYKEAFQNFFHEIFNYDFGSSQYTKSALIKLLSLEELVYRLNNDISLNINEPELNSLKLMDSFSDLLKLGYDV